MNDVQAMQYHFQGHIKEPQQQLSHKEHNRPKHLQ